MLTESEIIPGRAYLCRVSEHERRLLVLEAGPKLEWRTGLPPASAFATPGRCHGTIADGVEVLRELDLEAMAAECESPQAPRWSDEVEAEIERVGS